VNLQLLIDSIVRQTTVLIAQLATTGGARAPLVTVANQVFLDLADELAQQGVSRPLHRLRGLRGVQDDRVQ